MLVEEGQDRGERAGLDEHVAVDAADDLCIGLAERVLEGGRCVVVFAIDDEDRRVARDLRVIEPDRPGRLPSAVGIAARDDPDAEAARSASYGALIVVVVAGGTVVTGAAVVVAGATVVVAGAAVVVAGAGVVVVQCS
jgi:hypothetical protein